MKIKPVFSLLGILFISILVILSIIKIWMPEMIGADIFIKLTLSFAALALATLAIQLLSGLRKPPDETDGE